MTAGLRKAFGSTMAQDVCGGCFFDSRFELVTKEKANKLLPNCSNAPFEDGFCCELRSGRLKQTSKRTFKGEVAQVAVRRLNGGRLRHGEFRLSESPVQDKAHNMELSSSI